MAAIRTPSGAGAYTGGMRTIAYDRDAALVYARTWAFGRNPAYYNFDGLGGDCTNFVSQCLYAGTQVMNFIPVTGWFYRSANERTASWTGVEYLYRFLVGNEGRGPFAVEAPLESLAVGDLVQLGREDGDYYHTPIVTGLAGGQLLVAAHTFDAFDRPLSSYFYERIRGLHILGARTD